MSARLASLVGLLMLTAEGGAQTPDAPAHFVVGNLTGALNLRAGPSTTAAIVARLPPGTAVAGTQCRAAAGRTWCHVRAGQGGATGWAVADFLLPAGAAARAAAGSFDEIGVVICHVEGGAAERCDYGLARDPEGPMSLLIYLPDGATRRYDIDATTLSRDDGAGAPILSASADGWRLVDGASRYLLPGASLAP
ncbi:MAG: SH3 domain-containing protein [Rhodobacteraceae bacterium]|nr:SH3 domain-containing protein [Paracoccaceae bacterium]